MPPEFLAAAIKEIAGSVPPRESLARVGSLIALTAERLTRCGQSAAKDLINEKG
jgi:hypothetical protein